MYYRPLLRTHRLNHSPFARRPYDDGCYGYCFFRAGDPCVHREERHKQVCLEDPRRPDQAPPRKLHSRSPTGDQAHILPPRPHVVNGSVLGSPTSFVRSITLDSETMRANAPGLRAHFLSMVVGIDVVCVKISSFLFFLDYLCHPLLLVPCMI